MYIVYNNTICLRTETLVLRKAEEMHKSFIPGGRACDRETEIDMKAVGIKNTVLGDGVPKICVPITAADTDGISDALDKMRDADFDLIEWRADKFKELGSLASMTEAASLIREAFPDKPIIFTVRTSRDMEDFDISDEDYVNIYKLAAKHRIADIADVEYSRGYELASKLNTMLHDHDFLTVVSKHVRDHTPDKETMLATLIGMQQTGADIVKYAAMPKCERDVLNLMDATLSMREEHGETPVISMSMSRLGVLSRVSGALTGSALSFGTVGAASAPGQLDCGTLREILNRM